jgi:hypothetical protein
MKRMLAGNRLTHDGSEEELMQDVMEGKPARNASVSLADRSNGQFLQASKRDACVPCALSALLFHGHPHDKRALLN